MSARYSQYSKGSEVKIRALLARLWMKGILLVRINNAGLVVCYNKYDKLGAPLTQFVILISQKCFL